MKFWENFKKKCAKEYISSIATRDKSKSESNRWMILVWGNRIDDLTPGETQLIPFEETLYVKTKGEAEDTGKIAWNNGHKAEIWKLIKRFK